ncbi:MAG: hypothetical protein JST52_12045, partial [Bacteroidetes bacterium]|nr:hypothetical protein [Bacteroidota bacterium]
EARIRLVGTFGEPTVTEDIFPLLGFSAGDTWSIWKKGGKKGTTQYNGLYGAPEILTAGVNHDLVAKMPLTYFTNISSFAIPNPVNTGNPLYDPSFYSAPDNPLYVYNPVFWHNTLMHWVNYGSGNNDTLASWVIDAAMAYYRRWIPEVAKAIMSGSSTKTPIKTVIISDLVPSGNSTYPVIHRFNQLIGADISKVSLPSILSL